MLLGVSLILITSIRLLSASNSTTSDVAFAFNNDPTWGSILEEWIISGHREKRVLKSSLEQPLTVKEDVEIDKESKIAPGKIVRKKPQGSPGRQVSETDLYLLNAMEKLVYRIDFMEKRLRKLEEMLYYVMAGNRVDQDPCPFNFTRIGGNCYIFKNEAGREMDWKASNKHCQIIGAVLAEMETIEENQDIIAFIQTSPYLRGKDFWTGGLNPGLLWIWSNSARPVPTKNTKQPQNITGDGRCLRLAYDPRTRSYSYKGTDCGARYNYICELPDSNSSNAITRLGRSKNIFN